MPVSIDGVSNHAVIANIFRKYLSVQSSLVTVYRGINEEIQIDPSIIVLEKDMSIAIKK